jgi:hypothetical protein
MEADLAELPSLERFKPQQAFLQLFWDSIIQVRLGCALSFFVDITRRDSHITGICARTRINMSAAPT